MSWSYCEKHKIDIPNPGGGNLSRNLDEMRNLQDYVRLSLHNRTSYDVCCHERWEN
ncbi:hypothetical protein NXV33_06415 [Bacteroides thetaiotaomicron]|nr:hypothetical protein [Bacteroides thetaiotaomicron]